MKVIRENELIKTSRDVKFKQGTSLRYIIEEDNMGFTLCKTIISKGEKGHWHYKHHLEACYCIKGKGIITELDIHSNIIKSENISLGDCYILNNFDNHTFEALEDVILISIFNPPLNGNEIHLKDGSYKKNNYTKTLSKKIVKQVYSCNNYYDANDIIEEFLIKKN